MVTTLGQVPCEWLRRRGLRLEYATLAWNVVGIAVHAVAAAGVEFLMHRGEAP